MRSTELCVQVPLLCTSQSGRSDVYASIKKSLHIKILYNIDGNLLGTNFTSYNRYDKSEKSLFIAVMHHNVL